MKRASQCDRILEVLSDGEPHSMEEIHRRVGTCRLNSRIAELRERFKRLGIPKTITCDKGGGRYIYQLIDSPREVREGANGEQADSGDQQAVGLGRPALSLTPPTGIQVRDADDEANAKAGAGEIATLAPVPGSALSEQRRRQ